MLAAVRRAWAFLWDPAEPTLRLRIGAAVTLMLAGKLTTIQVPFIFKYAIDALESGDWARGLADGAAGLDDAALPTLADGAATAAAGSSPWLAVAALTPPTLMLMYGTTRAAASAMDQLRNALFSTVAEGALRRMAKSTFLHLHSMELRFHLNRQTGALTRVVDRGTRAVGTLLSTSVLQVIPLAFEVSVVSGLLAHNCGGPFALASLGTLGCYATFTFVVTQARTHVRRAQNQADNAASQLFTDSMINYETVKYFGATGLEGERYDAALQKYQRAATTTQLTLAGLNFGQNAIYSAGIGAAMWLAAAEVGAGRMSIGDVVMVQGLMMQLTVPLTILGTVYNQVRTASTDMDALMKLQQQRPEISSPAGAPPLELSAGRIEFDNVHFGYSEDAPLLRGLSFEALPGQTLAIVGGSGSGKSSILRLLYRFFDPTSGEVRVDGQRHDTVLLIGSRRV